jgi:hypothetical protein
MKKFVTAMGVSALAVCALAAGGSATSSDSACPDGYALTAGGIPEADADGDGFTCERATVEDGETRVVAVDNRAPGPPRQCPEGFTASDEFPGEEPDRNANGVVCSREHMSGRGPVLIVIDDIGPREPPPDG